MKKIFTVLLSFAMVFSIMAATSVEALAASSFTTLEFHQSRSAPSPTVFLTKNLKVKAANYSTDGRKVSVGVVNKTTGKTVAIKTISNTNNQMVQTINLDSIAAGNYYVQLTCSTGSKCKGSALLEGN